MVANLMLTVCITINHIILLFRKLWDWNYLGIGIRSDSCVFDSSGLHFFCLFNGPVRTRVIMIIVPVSQKFPQVANDVHKRQNGRIVWVSSLSLSLSLSSFFLLLALIIYFNNTVNDLFGKSTTNEHNNESKRVHCLGSYTNNNSMRNYIYIRQASFHSQTLHLFSYFFKNVTVFGQLNFSSTQKYCVWFLNGFNWDNLEFSFSSPKIINHYEPTPKSGLTLVHCNRFFFFF
jgi:hypothetical protein